MYEICLGAHGTCTQLDQTHHVHTRARTHIRAHWLLKMHLFCPYKHAATEAIYMRIHRRRKNSIRTHLFPFSFYSCLEFEVRFICKVQMYYSLFSTSREEEHEKEKMHRSHNQISASVCCISSTVIRIRRAGPSNLNFAN